MKKIIFFISLLILNDGWALRIVSTAPAITDIIIDLGKASDLAGISRYCNRSEISQKIARIGTAITPDYETILKLKQDLVFVQTSQGPKMSNYLKRLKIKSIALSFKTMREIGESYQKSANILGVPKKANAFFDRVAQAMGRMPQFIRAESYLIVLDSKIVLGKMKTAYVVGRGTYLDDILKHPGLENAVKTRVATPVWDLEKVMGKSPDWVFLLFASNISKKEIQKNAGVWKKIQGINPKKVKVIHGDFALIPGPRVVGLIDEFSKLIK